MSNSLEAQGVIHSIGQTTEYGNNGFTKREFVIKLTGEHEKEEYPNYVAFELIKDKCSLMDSYQPQMPIKVLFNLQGRLWQGQGKPEKCFNALQAWKVESLSAPQQQAQQQHPQAPQNNQANGGYNNQQNQHYPQQQAQQPINNMANTAPPCVDDFDNDIPF